MADVLRGIDGKDAIPWEKGEWREDLEEKERRKIIIDVDLSFDPYDVNWFIYGDNNFCYAGFESGAVIEISEKEIRAALHMLFQHERWRNTANVRHEQFDRDDIYCSFYLFENGILVDDRDFSKRFDFPLKYVRECLSGVRYSLVKIYKNGIREQKRIECPELYIVDSDVRKEILKNGEFLYVIE